MFLYFYFIFYSTLKLSLLYLCINKSPICLSIYDKSTDKIFRKKLRWKLYQNVESSLEQVVEISSDNKGSIWKYSEVRYNNTTPKTTFQPSLFLATDEMVADVIHWQASHRTRGKGIHRKTYIDQLVDDTLCIPDEILNAMDNR